MVIEDLVGQELVSEWRPIEQARIDEFARATDDPQWIHTDPEAGRGRPVRDDDRARLPDALARRADVREALPPLDGYGMTLNYGPQPGPLHLAGAVGARIRGRFRIEDVEDVAFGKQARVAATIELEGQEKPACVAEALFRFLNPA